MLGLLGPTQTSPRNLAPHRPLHATVAQHHQNKQRCFKAINQNRLTSNFDTTAVNCQATIQNCNTVPAKVLICVCSVDSVRMLDERQSVSAHNKDIVPVHNRLKKPSSRKMIQGDKSHTKKQLHLHPQQQTTSSLPLPLQLSTVFQCSPSESAKDFSLWTTAPPSSGVGPRPSRPVGTTRGRRDRYCLEQGIQYHCKMILRTNGISLKRSHSPENWGEKSLPTLLLPKTRTNAEFRVTKAGV